MRSALRVPLPPDAQGEAGACRSARPLPARRPSPPPGLGRRPPAAWAALLAAVLVGTGCVAPGAHQAGLPRYRCLAPFNAGWRVPGALNPAYPTTGVYPASGAFPPPGAPGITLRVLAPALVLTYGQPLETAGVRLPTRVVPGAPDGPWQTVPVAAGYTFRLFGAAVPLFGVVPAPVLTGPRAARARFVWLVTQWDAVQDLVVLRGDDALAGSTSPWRLVPPGVTSDSAARARELAAQEQAQGWRAVGRFPATPACGAPPSHLGPFGARATLKLPLDVPLELISPEYGSMVFEVSAGGAPR
jgi:hypothetical protein